MSGFSKYEHNDLISLPVQICEVFNSGARNREYHFRVKTVSGEKANLLIWEKSPAADVEWEFEKWFQLQNVLVKKWDGHVELNATKRTSAEQIERPPTSEATSGQSSATISESEQKKSQSECSSDSGAFLHVGPINYGSSNITADRRKEFRRGLEQTIQLAIDHQVDAIVQTGQLFATRSPTSEDCSALEDQLQRARDNGVTFIHAGSERDHDMSIVDVLSEDDLIERPGASPVVVKDAAFYGLPPEENAEPRTVLQDFRPPSQEVAHRVVCAPMAIEPSNSLNSLSADEITQKAAIEITSVLAGHRSITSSTRYAENGDLEVYLAGPTEFLLRKPVLEAPPDYPCQIAKYTPENQYELIDLDHRAIEIHAVECTPSATLADIKTEINPERKTILINLQGERSPSSFSTDAVEQWLDSKTAVYKVWDERDPSESPSTNSQTEAISVTTVYESSGISSEQDAEGSVSRSNNLSQQPDGTNSESPSKQQVEPNRVSELYESFRSLRTVLDFVIDESGIDISPDDMGHPLVQYRAVIRAMVGKREYLPAEVDGFGGQQAERVPVEMTEYRDEYGNGEWVTDYQCIDVEPVSETTRYILEENGFTEDASLLVRPIAPGTGNPLPEFPTSETELDRAFSLLSRFDTEPALPWDSSIPFKFPVEAVYNRVCDVEGIDGMRVGAGRTDSVERDGKDGPWLKEVDSNQR